MDTIYENSERFSIEKILPFSYTRKDTQSKITKITQQINSQTRERKPNSGFPFYLIFEQPLIR
jgi:hypothetical protein